MSAIQDHGPQYQAALLDEKYAWVNERPGAGAVEAAATSVTNLGTTLGTVTAAAGTAMRGLGVSWAGPASDAARRSTEKTVNGASETQQLTENGAAQITEYGRSFEVMRRQIAEPYDYGWLGNLAVDSSMEALSVWADGPDYGTRETLNRGLNDVAIRALHAHEENTRRADEKFTTAGANPQPAPGSGGEAPGGGTTGAGVSSPASPIPQVESAGLAPGAVPGADAPAPGSVPGGPGGPGIPGGGQAAGGTGATPPGAAAVAGPAGLGTSGRSRPADAGGASTGAGGTGTRTGVGGTGTTGTAGGAGGATGPVGAAATGGVAGPGGGSGRGADPARSRREQAERFERDLKAGRPGTASGTDAQTPRTGYYGSGVPGARGGPVSGRVGGSVGPGYRGTGSGRTGYGGTGYSEGRYGSTGRSGSGYGGSAGSGGLRPGTPGATETGPGSGARSSSRSFGAPGEGGAIRPAVGEPGATARTGTGYGAGYGPMMGGVGGMRSGGDGHHNRYLLPSSEPFDVELPHSPAVLAPDEEE